MLKRPWLILPTLGVVAFVALAACGDDDDDTGDDGDGGGDLTAEEQAAVDYMNDSIIGLYNAGDYEGFIAEFTDDGLIAFIGIPEIPVEELRSEAPMFLEGEPPVENAEFPEVAATADSATVRVISTSGNVVNNERFTLVKDGDDFQVDNFESLEVALPDGVSAFEVSGIDFGYEFDGEDAADGIRALDFTNAGEQFHEIFFVQATEEAPELDAAVNEFVHSDDFPVWISTVVAMLTAAPGESDSVIFAEDLPAARYLMFCLIPDQSVEEGGPPHATLGMAAEFTIE
jgi:hypothetical protein